MMTVELWIVLLIIPLSQSEALVETDLKELYTSNVTSNLLSKQCNNSFLNVNCHCDDLCRFYNDCCFDGSANIPADTTEEQNVLTCLEVPRSLGVYSIKQCSSFWNGPLTVREKCENEDDLSDPLMSAPATNTHTNITYRNKYCAQCNDENLCDLATWSLMLTCRSLFYVEFMYHNITDDFILDNIVRVGMSWGVYHWNPYSAVMTFFPCDITISLPASVKPHVRHCFPNTVSQCAANWMDTSVKQNCESYTAVVFEMRQSYRNVHCAMCNSVPMNSITYYPASALTDYNFGSILSMNYVIFLHHNHSTEMQESSVTAPCSTNQLYNPFLKNCTTTCTLPSTRRGGRKTDLPEAQNDKETASIHRKVVFTASSFSRHVLVLKISSQIT